MLRIDSVIYDSGQVSLEQLLLSRNPSQSIRAFQSSASLYLAQRGSPLQGCFQAPSTLAALRVVRQHRTLHIQKDELPYALS